MPRSYTEPEVITLLQADAVSLLTETGLRVGATQLMSCEDLPSRQIGRYVICLAAVATSEEIREILQHVDE